MQYQFSYLTSLIPNHNTPYPQNITKISTLYSVRPNQRVIDMDWAYWLTAEYIQKWRFVKVNVGIQQQINLEPSIRIYHHMNTNQNLSQNFLQDLYLSKNTNISQPVLQILAFQPSENHPKQIVIRLSDGVTFFDATLIGPYQLSDNKIKVSPFTAYHGTMEFNKLDIIKLVDFFSKIDLSRICRLKMMIRKIVQIKSCSHKIGRPQEISFYMEINHLVTDTDVSIPPANEREDRNTTHWQTTEVKINEDDEPIKEIQNRDAKGHQKKTSIINKELQFLGICKDRNPDDPLTFRELMNGYDGFFIGRLLRIKNTVKDGKEGSIPMLSLGFIDSAGDMMRLNLLGKMALRQQKQLKRGKCYYLKGLEVVQTKGSSYIKLREKDYKLHVLTQQNLTSKFSEEYYHWEHEFDYIENENVDVVGVVEDIQQKTFYGTKSVGDTKEAKQVIRVVIRNKFKIVKVSFWSDQLKNLLKFNLKKGDTIYIEDVRKKKLVFLDYSAESTLIKLQASNELYIKLQHLLPEQVQYPQPFNIQSLYHIQSIDRFNAKTHTIYAYLSKIHDQKMIFKFCDLCKKKININSVKCYECKANVVSIKYNTVVQFTDYSGSLMLSVFDNVAQKLFGMSALALKEMTENGSQDYDKFIDRIIYEPFLIGVEVKSERFILRTVEPLKEGDLTKWYGQSIKQIQKLTQPSLQQ